MARSGIDGVHGGIIFGDGDDLWRRWRARGIVSRGGDAVSIGVGLDWVADRHLLGDVFVGVADGDWGVGAATLRLVRAFCGAADRRGRVVCVRIVFGVIQRDGDELVWSGDALADSDASALGGARALCVDP